jgi:hypothetical protein
MVGLSQESMNISGSTRSRLGEVCVLNDLRLASMISGSGAVTSLGFVLGGLNFQDENPQADLRWPYLTMAVS